MSRKICEVGNKIKKNLGRDGSRKNDIRYALLQRIERHVSPEDDTFCKQEQSGYASDSHKKWFENMAPQNNMDRQEQDRHER